MAWHKVCDTGDIWSGEMLGVECQEQQIVLINHDGVIYAYADQCAHKGIRVSEGKIHDHTLRCPAHGWEYDITTGQGINPKRVCLQAYSVVVRNGSVFVDLANNKRYRNDRP